MGPEQDVAGRPRWIPVAGPWITDKETEYVAHAAASDWYEEAGTYSRRFEEAFAAYVGRRYAISLPSGTSGIHLSLLALGVGPGDEVVVPEITWIASAAPVSYVGATPAFADVEASTWCLSPESFESMIGPRTKAVIPVDLYGSMPDLDGIREVARRHGVAVIEDAAGAVGSSYKGSLAGSFGDTSVFSFHGSKTLTTGEGGMVVTDSEALHARMTFLRDHGRMPGDTSFLNAEVAHKYKMSSLQAALGLAQLERVEELLGRKRMLYGWYTERLEDLGADVHLNPMPPGADVVPWMVTAVFGKSTGLTKDAVGGVLAFQGIDTRPFFHPLSSLPAYAGRRGVEGARERNPVSYDISPRAISLPSALRLAESDIDVVASAIRGLLVGSAPAATPGISLGAARRSGRPGRVTGGR